MFLALALCFLFLSPTASFATTFMTAPAIAGLPLSPYTHHHALVFDGNSFDGTGTFTINGNIAILQGEAPIEIAGSNVGYSYLFDFEAAPPSPDNPKLELNDIAYIDHGGPIDPSTWTYYRLIDGTLDGFGDWNGIHFNLMQRGPNFQLGYGANGKNADFGFSGWFESGCRRKLSDCFPGDVNISLAETPEPATYLLLGTGLICLGVYLRNKQKWPVSR